MTAAVDHRHDGLSSNALPDKQRREREPEHAEGITLTSPLYRSSSSAADAALGLQARDFRIGQHRIRRRWRHLHPKDSKRLPKLAL
jgi:hypothetical protein